MGFFNGFMYAPNRLHVLSQWFFDVFSQREIGGINRKYMEIWNGGFHQWWYLQNGWWGYSNWRFSGWHLVSTWKNIRISTPAFQLAVRRYILRETFTRNDDCGMFRIIFKVSKSQIVFINDIGICFGCWEDLPSESTSIGWLGHISRLGLFMFVSFFWELISKIIFHDYYSRYFSDLILQGKLFFIPR